MHGLYKNVGLQFQDPVDETSYGVSQQCQEQSADKYLVLMVSRTIETKILGRMGASYQAFRTMGAGSGWAGWATGHVPTLEIIRVGIAHSK